MTHLFVNTPIGTIPSLTLDMFWRNSISMVACSSALSGM